MTDEAKEFHWADDAGHRIQGVEWPVESPIAVVGFIHGLGEHSRRYDHYADFLTRRGIACLAYDRKGHGRSEGVRGFAADYKLYVDEAAKLTIECGKRYPGVPLFLYGHSMGGQVLLRYLVRRHPKVKGAIVSAPHIRLPFTPSAFQVTLGKFMRKIKPDFTQPNPLDTRMLSRDPIVVEKYLADPLVHNLISAQTGIDMLENALLLDQWAGELSVPTLLMHGDEDGITSYEGSKDFVDRNPVNITLKIWPGFYHELHNEPEWEEVASFVTSWIEGVLAT